MHAAGLHFDVVVMPMMRVTAACCAGWKVHHVAGRCLYDHNPSPQRCTRMGGVWDDSGSALQHSGGECITEAQAQQRYDAAAGAIQMEVVQLSHDGGLAGFGEWGAHSTIRQEDNLSAKDSLAPQ